MSNIVAVDVGGTKTVVAVERLEGPDRFLELGRFPTDGDPEVAARNIVQTIRDGDVKPAAVGIGCPGPLDPSTGTLVAPPNLRGWWGFPLAPRIEEQLGVPVRLENDANVGALGEAIHGSGRGSASIYYLTISTGIGAGYVVNGKILGGYKTMAGEIWALDPGSFFGELTGESIEDRASGPGLIRGATRRIREGGTTTLTADGLDTRILLAAAEKGDPVAVEALEAGRNAIAGTVVSILVTVAPDSIVLAGGLCTESRWFVDPVKERVAAWLPSAQLKEIPIYRAELWDSAVLFGAAELVRDLM